MAVGWGVGIMESQDRLPQTFCSNDGKTVKDSFRNLTSI